MKALSSAAWRRIARVAALGVAWTGANSFANPEGMTVTAGSASANLQGHHLQVIASDQAVLHWQSFNIDTDQRASFLQPSPASVVWNHIGNSQPSQIFGRLDANGVVVLVNPAGFHFGPDAVVDAAGLVVSTASPAGPPSDPDQAWRFQNPPPASAIVNFGHLHVQDGGSLFLIAHHVENHGDITASGGSVGLVAGQEVLLAERADGRSFNAKVRVPEGAIDQHGRIIADAGQIALHASVVNQDGFLQADAVRERGGIIELVASESLTLGDHSTIRSAGSGSEISVRSAGQLTVNPGATLDLRHSESAPEATSSGQLTLAAGTKLTLENGTRLELSGDWSAHLRAGIATTESTDIQPGIGRILLAGTATVQTDHGTLDARAGNDVTLEGGALRSVGGGDVAVTSVAGSVNAGSSSKGYLFRPGGYSVDPDLGGIATADGGDVTVSAGLDIISHLPRAGEVQTDAGSGAFGSAPGDVTLTAGRDVSGHFVVGHGVGTIQAGRDAGTPVRPLALSLIDGGWSVVATRDVRLQEIRNPNGMFNNLGFLSSPTRQRFDYTTEAYADLSAGRGVALLGTGLPRYLDAFSRDMPPIYPGTLRIRAGAGGVTLDNDVILFPSPNGQLSVTTTDGGSLTGTKAGDLVEFVLTDSGRVQYRNAGDFGRADHAATPLHLEDDEPVRLDVSGDMTGLLVVSAKRAEIHVAGDMINSRFEGQNLRDSDVTSIHVEGDMINRSEFTSVDLDTPPRFEVFDLVYPPLAGTAAALPNLFVYDTGDRQLTLKGRMTGEQLLALSTLRVRAFDAFGQPLVDPATGEPITVPAEFVGAAALQQIYDGSQDIPANPDTGYFLGGGGQFRLLAHHLDLGATLGIVAAGPRANPALARIFDHGASIRVDLGGDLTMASSRIATLNGGSIDLQADGAVRIGTKIFDFEDTAARGIYTTDPSDITITARHDITVNGSRIAAYDGGNLTLRSLEGSIDAGSGGRGAASVEKIVVDPVTRAVRSYTSTLPGSGILATSFPSSPDSTFPASSVLVGNILVETPRGDIRAQAGGIVQIPLNGRESPDRTVILRAGSRDADGHSSAPGNLDLRGSGVVGSTVILEANGDILGTVVARNDLEVAARLSANIAALAEGNIHIEAGERLTGTLIGLGGIAAGADSIDAALLSQSVSSRGESDSAQLGFTAGNAATAASQALPTGDPEVRETVLSGDNSTATDEPRVARPRRNPASPSSLAPDSGRVTLLLPHPSP
ncbi:MAG: filamentous hemagglutinin N-terminal domain-containing protein [Verrucomicrobiales bacterium]|nr:filamentous hemagglutinin N-terminal domain-containing protein [Verrucomicrobiales bacterium]